MTNKLRSILAVSALAATAAVLPAFGADTDPMRISVPFAFKAGKATLPAGDYTVVGENSGIVMIRGNAGSAILLSTSNNDNSSDKAGLSFTRGEQGYVLKCVRGWTGSSNILPLTAEK